MGVTTQTLRRWEAEGVLVPEARTLTNHRRYSLEQLQKYSAQTVVENKVTVAYARVSSVGQKEDLERQKQLLELFCASHGWQYVVIADLGSGINYKKKGLNDLINRVLLREVERLVLSHKDRLLRFGAEIIFSICASMGVEVIILNQAEESTFEEDLTKDVLEIITVFSAKLYGSRSHKNKKLLAALQEAVL